MAAVEVDVAGELVEAAGVDAEDEADGDQHQHDERADAARLARAAAHLPRPPSRRSSSGPLLPPHAGTKGESRSRDAREKARRFCLLAWVRSGRELGSGRVVRSGLGVRARPLSPTDYKGRG